MISRCLKSWELLMSDFVDCPSRVSSINAYLWSPKVRTTIPHACLGSPETRSSQVTPSHSCSQNSQSDFKRDPPQDPLGLDSLDAVLFLPQMKTKGNIVSPLPLSSVFNII